MAHPNGVNLGPTRTVVFFREEGWYPLDLPEWDDLAEHARRNPGTLRIEDLDGNVLWSAVRH